MKKLLICFLKIEENVCAAAFVIMIISCIIQVLNRNIIKLSIGWTEELARYSMIWMAFIGTAISLRQGKQMSIGLLYDKGNNIVKKLLRIFSHIACAIFALLTAWFSIDQLMMQIKANQLSTALKIPSALVFSIITITFFIMAIGEIVATILEFTGKENASESKEETA